MFYTDEFVSSKYLNIKKRNIVWLEKEFINRKY